MTHGFTAAYRDVHGVFQGFSGCQYLRLGEFLPSEINNHLQMVGRCGDEACVLDRAGLRRLGVTPTYGRLHINDSGAVAGLRVVGGRPRPFIWSNGAVTNPPAPQDDIAEVTEFTDNGWLLIEGQRSYLVVGTALLDLTAAFGGSVRAINAQGMLGGLAGGLPFVRLPDGRTYIPWNTSTPVTLVGSGGHFAGVRNNRPTDWYYGDLNGRITTVPWQDTLGPLGVATILTAMNGVGEVIGFFARHGPRPALSLSCRFLFPARGARFAGGASSVDRQRHQR
jgi:hypothetical protein